METKVNKKNGNVNTMHKPMDVNIFLLAANLTSNKVSLKQ